MPPRRKTAAVTEDTSNITTKRQRHDDAKEDETCDNDVCIGPAKAAPVLDNATNVTERPKLPFTSDQLTNCRKTLKPCETTVKRAPLHTAEKCHNAPECCRAPIVHSRSSSTRVESVVHADGTGSAHIHSQREVDGICIENKDVDITRDRAGHVTRTEVDALEHKTPAIQHKD